MPEEEHHQFYQSISIKLLTRVFANYVLVAILVTFLHVVIEFYSQKKDVRVELEQLQEVIQPSLLAATKNYDLELIESNLKGNIKIPTLIGIEVEDENSELLAFIGTTERQKKNDIDESPYFSFKHSILSELIAHRFNLIVPEYGIVGTVTLYSNGEVVFDRVKLGFVFILINAFIKTAALWIIFSVISRSMLNRPLSKLIEQIRGVSIEILDTNNCNGKKVEIGGREKTELQIIEDSFNEMLARLKQALKENKRNQKRINLIATALLDSSDGVVIADKYGKVIEVNRALLVISQYSESELVGVDYLSLISKLSDSNVSQYLVSNLESSGSWSGEIRGISATGKDLTLWVSISSIKSSNGEIENYLILFNDMSRLRESQQELEFLAFHDSLTKLNNKFSLEQRLKSRVDADSLVLLNIDNFSYINMVYGYSFGDKLLIKISLFLKEIFGLSHLYRIDSDEFALYFEDDEEVVTVIETIQSYFSDKNLEIDGITLNVTFTFGAAVKCDELLRSAKLALKKAKEEGKNRFLVYEEDQSIIDNARREQFVVYNNLLHKAIANDWVVPFFQGIRDNHSGKIDKYEVLARIKTEDEIVSPYHFLEPARMSGLLPNITKAIIEKSFLIMQHFSDVSFNINITEDDLSRRYLVDFLAGASKRHSIDPSRVTLEILEGVSASGKQSNVSQLVELKKQGYLLAIDDFGSEYSNFERIYSLDVDFIKIDSKYIKDINTNKKSYEITKAIVNFSKSANIKVVAEFVHSKEVQKVIEDLGIDYSQGYFFSEPMERLQIY
ncbi:EAL domain-containing protein [Pleionea sediminis]|uniref:EAL domain-containing protein n=1 Tax=Pleionea sediminis TaxID=2569479 RepID=UPI001184BBBE|nr:EAL domain-containing protein [Pleionea sediminis]